MSFLAFITHPEVTIEPAVPVHHWKLSEVGRKRAAQLLKQPWITEVQTIFSSDEKKAAETAQILAEGLSLSFQTNPKFGEIDRSSTGYLPELEHTKQVQEWFNHPEASINGWERGVDAQDRIVRATKDVIDFNPGQNIAIVSHGGVGALLLAHYKKMPIHSRHSQEKLGSFFVYDIEVKRVKLDWHPIDLEQRF
jgi:broad specificity phosphatase PhoE